MGLRFTVEGPQVRVSTLTRVDNDALIVLPGQSRGREREVFFCLCGRALSAEEVVDVRDPKCGLRFDLDGSQLPAISSHRGTSETGKILRDIAPVPG